jgi:phosphoglycolate phosphatase-like HAD superfamily hydrolase
MSSDTLSAQAQPQTLALDFDGILCNGLREYLQSTWRTYRQIWPTSTELPPDTLAESFFRLRPVIETGWEMPVLLRAILKGFTESSILDQWPEIRDRVVAQEDLAASELGPQLDAVRDRWIQTDLSGWLGLHNFYPGAIELVQRLLNREFPLFIITTKESRFVAALLQQHGVEFPRDRIFGKDSHRPKADTLRLLQQTAPTPIWFVEDRLVTLQKIQTQSDLAEIGLFLGDWGYNTPRELQSATQDPRINLLSLSQLNQEFSAWVSH